MKFIIQRDHLAAGLSQVANVVNPRATLPVLSNILFEAEGDTLSLTATNMDVGIRVRVKADVKSNGRITLNAKRLLTIVRVFEKSEVTVELNGLNVKLSAGSQKFQLAGLHPDDPNNQFPPLATFANQHCYSLPKEEFGRLLRKVAYAQSVDEGRLVLVGVNVTFTKNETGEGERVTAVATDGRRLAYVSKIFPSVGVAEGESGFILPSKSVAEVQRILSGKGDVKIAFDDRQVAFDAEVLPAEKDEADTGLRDHIHFVSKLGIGVYPNYKQVIPKEAENRIKLERVQLLKIVNSAAIMASEKGATIHLKFGDGKITATGQISDVGESEDSMVIDDYAGPPVTIAFNPQYLTDTLQALEEDTIYYDFKDEMSPCIVRAADDFHSVIMPQRA
ncbi:MAG: DNA polymerase III subunit beta [Puniceicoccales bacterium]|jgi:DNA polymerase-3 subunit beta|nr:DNA polymerase III subunit beta [Puniceicoccales bacterium]